MVSNLVRTSVLLCAALSLVSCGQQDEKVNPDSSNASEISKDTDPLEISTPPADRVFVGQILTMTPDTAEAVVIDDGKIIATGSEAAIKKYIGAETVVTQLGSNVLMPGFVQAHAHFSFLALKSAAVPLDPPPIGEAGSIDSIVEIFKTALETMPDKSIALVGMGYDDTLLVEQRHPTREDLDRVSSEIPILALHISGHLATMNSMALELAGITAEMTDPEGGVIRRQSGTMIPNGVVEESALALAFKLFPQPSPQQVFGLYQQTAAKLASLGITTAADHATDPATEAGLAAFAGTGKLPIDLVAYRNVKSGLPESKDVSQDYNNRFRLGGIKIVQDGSIQGWTGWLTKPYFKQRADVDEDYRGYPIFSQQELNGYISKAYQENWPMLVHTNGDEATDMLISSVVAASNTFPDSDVRPTIIHAQMMRDDQLDKAKTLNMIPSFFVDHVYYWGDRHEQIFMGPERARRISPAGSAVRKELHFTLHDDAPVVPPHPLRTVWVAVNRTTRSGKVLGEEQKITVADALKAVTIDAAYQHLEEVDKGSISVGKNADLIILDQNPIEIDPQEIRDIQVLETIKDGETIFLGER